MAERRPIKLVLKENTVSNKDTKDGEKQIFKNVLKGNIGEIEVSLTLKAEQKDLLDEVTAPKLREELYIAIVPNPQTTLDSDEGKEEKEKERTDKTEHTEKPGRKRKPGKDIVDAEHRLMEPQKGLPAGSDENILSEIA